MPRIEPALKSALVKELEKGEKLAWSGVPDASKIFAPSDVFAIPFSLVWGGFAIFWEVLVVQKLLVGQMPGPAQFILPIWGIPFVLIGLYLIFGRFFVVHNLKKNTIYGITDKRAIIVSTWPGKKVVSVDLRRLGPITKTGNDDCGSLIFGYPGPIGSLMRGMEVMSNVGGGYARGQRFSFFDINRPREAYAILTKMCEEADKITDKHSQAGDDISWTQV